MQAPDTVVFDIGAVLLDWDPRYLYRRMFGDDVDAMEWFLAHVCTPDWNREQDRGRDWGVAVDMLVRRFPEWRREIEAYDARWDETVAGPIEGTVELLRQLHREGTPLYAITNFSSPKFAASRRRFDFLNLFRGVLVSGDERLLKPDREIYERFCDRYDLSPAQCFFIDDSAANVEGARAFGMRAVRFVDPATLARDLGAAGFAVAGVTV